MSAGQRLSGTPVPMHHWSGADGIRLVGDAWGDPSAPLVMLLHGSGQTRHAWKRTGEALGAAGYRAIALDARGHGDSDWSPDGVYNLDLMVRDLQAVLSQEEACEPILVGASMGGGTSLVAVGEGVVRAAALVLVDFAPRVEASGAQNVQAFMQRNPGGFASLAEVADAIANYQPHRTRSSNLGGLATNVRLGADGRYHWHWDPRFLQGPRQPVRRSERLEASARALTIPSMLVRGGLSDVLSEEGVAEFLAMVPGCEYVNIPSAGHMVAGDRNDAFGNAVAEFLAQVRPAGAARVLAGDRA